MSDQERRVGRVYYTRAQARAGNPETDPFNYDDAPEQEEEFHDNEEEQLLNQGVEDSVRDYGRHEKQEPEPVIVFQTEQNKEHQDGWYCDCYQCGQVEEVEALAITRAKAKGPINWREQKDVRGKVHEKVQKEQVQYAEEENEELEIPKKQQKLDKAGLLPIKEDKDWFESSFGLEKEPKRDVVGTSSIHLSSSVGASRKSSSPKPKSCKTSPSSSLRKALRIARGKILCKYGTYKISNNAYPKFLKVDLIDKEGSHTITFVVANAYIPQLVECFQGDDYVHIEVVSVKQRVKTDGGTSVLALHADATTLIVKGEPFTWNLMLYPEHKIVDLFGGKQTFDNPMTKGFVVVDNYVKRDGESAYRLIIADGPNLVDKATLLFVPSRRQEYHRIVGKLKSIHFMHAWCTT
ncbi:hypothetical protein L7F22_026209 [Adiantum nelumboides]|nr:hypothetical protein [Adiantum nelumboides]